ncbi:MAG TPA: hypothetical protein DHV96_14075 [Lachnospiraceae bacterium]|nr:hypothetical protein [Lachnospiraceae bacterium]
MSTGISISSINRIKELAEEKKFAEALEILDTQNLDKSINPQFLRISGEIFRENKRYYDSRKYLLKAHQMSPQGTRIIYELILLYLELGYYSRAQKYYEQYKFYVAPEDTQQDYLEYLVKKAQGEDIKEIAAVLIPILERMPDDRWNFEAILLYDKMGRKDKALEESQYILENFRDSIYVQPVIDYIDDKLDVDQYFYCYPKEEQPEDQEMFGDLIAQEDAILEADHLRMYPPEARIMVEADDKDGIDVKPVKEKKKKKKTSRKKNKEENQTEATESAEHNKDDVKEEKEQLTAPLEAGNAQAETKSDESAAEGSTDDHAEESLSGKIEHKETQDADHVTVDAVSLEEQQKNEREAALEKILSKKVDKEKILETARHVAQSVKDINTAKAKTQVKSVADALKDNVSKATGSLSDAVAAKLPVDAEPIEQLSDEFVDGIIESVLEPPKKTVGEVVMNEELDALIPDSLEAMSAEEIADIEAKKEEEERIELEALEASMRLEEEKKEARLRRWNRKDSGTEEVVIPEEVVIQEGVTAQKIATVSFEELKAQFLADNQEEEPLDTLGFMSVVQSDVDDQMKEAIPQEAEILHQMIDNKEYYTGEDSGQFESKASYEQNDFVVEDYSFDSWQPKDSTNERSPMSEQLAVQEIYAEEPIVDFEEIIPSVEMQDLEEKNAENLVFKESIIPEEKQENVWEPETEENLMENIIEDQVIEQPQERVEEQETEEEAQESIEKQAIEEPQECVEQQETEEMSQEGIEEQVTEEPQELVEEQKTGEALLENIEEQVIEEETQESIEDQVIEEASQDAYEEIAVTESVAQENRKPNREELRVRIIIRDDMVRKLSELKESRC